MARRDWPAPWCCMLPTLNKPSFAIKLNQNGLNPLHLALLNENKETALSLFTVNNDCPECIHDVTNRNDTALHLAARPGKLKAFQVLLPCLWSREYD
ncbi:hypothetical protein PVK06_036523 [Gossypium arboreum]|uniref:Uncharacterized protein n=1 Tax=Gossypium arboreum TaxID=29729 RepID=A0ABR0NK56_GOSAR|nr:hypothetical protein PVK06_036523 [Gossypium arboreum]